MEGELTFALDEARRGGDHAALVHLLTAWRLGRGPRLAALVELASTRASQGRSPVVATSSMQAGWEARAASKDPADLPVLLKVLGEGRKEQIIARLETLSKWPDDPRFHRRMVELLVEPPLAAKAGRAVSQRVFAALLRSRDHELARIAAAMFAREAPYQYVRARLRTMAAFVANEFEVVATKMQKFKPPPPLSASVVWLCEEIEVALKVERTGSRSGAALLAAVYAAPADDQARLVYADWLTEQGDPRGEFIVLQCERARAGGIPSKRERQLEKQFGRTWAEPLGLKMVRSSLAFSRGFLSEGSIARLRPEPEGYLGHSSWATLEVVRFNDAGVGAVEVVNHAACASVKGVLQLPASEFPKLTRQVERLGISYFRLDSEISEALLKHRALRRLEVDLDDDPKPLKTFLTAKMPWVEELVLPSGVWGKNGSTWLLP